VKLEGVLGKLTFRLGMTVLDELIKYLSDVKNHIKEQKLQKLLDETIGKFKDYQNDATVYQPSAKNVPKPPTRNK
jgi:hypothetical protein